MKKVIRTHEPEMTVAVTKFYEESEEQVVLARFLRFEEACDFARGQEAKLPPSMREDFEFRVHYLEQGRLTDPVLRY